MERGGVLHTQQAGSRGGKKNLKVEKKEKEEQRHGSAPGAPRLPGRSHALRAGTIFPQPSAEQPRPPPGTQRREAGDEEARVSW